jgi:hypothetical protein
MIFIYFKRDTMPLKRGTEIQNGMRVYFWQWGPTGHKYIFDPKNKKSEEKAKDSAHKQAIAINMSKKSKLENPQVQESITSTKYTDKAYGGCRYGCPYDPKFTFGGVYSMFVDKHPRYENKSLGLTRGGSLITDPTIKADGLTGLQGKLKSGGYYIPNILLDQTPNGFNPYKQPGGGYNYLGLG